MSAYSDLVDDLEYETEIAAQASVKAAQAETPEQVDKYLGEAMDARERVHQIMLELTDAPNPTPGRF